MASVSLEHGASPQTLDAVLKIHFKDAHTWDVAIRELSSINHSVTFEVVGSEPAALVTSAIHTISLKKISAGGSYIEWVSDFSADASPEVILDATYKRKEAFEDLRKALAAVPSSPRP